MTVALGLVCADGVVVASDSMASDSNNTAFPAVKVHALANSSAVWTAAGSVYVIEEVDRALNMADAKCLQEGQCPEKRALLEGDLGQLRDRIGGAINKTMKSCYEAALPHGLNAGTSDGRHRFASDFLLLGWTNAGAYFLEHASDGQMNWHTAKGFYAVGSGGAFATVAQALMAHYLEGPPLPVDQGLQIAFRAIETTCSVSAGLVGEPVQLAVANGDGARILDEDEIEKVKTAVSGWKELERSTFQAVDTPPATAEAIPQMLDEGT